MPRYNLDTNPNTLENDLVKRVRRCWNNRRGSTDYERNNLKDAISELRTFRTNREINPELHAALDTEAVENYQGSGFLGYPEYKWEIFCRNKHLLTRTRIDEPRQESLIKGLPVIAEKTKGRVRTRPPAEKITQDYFTKTLQAIDTGELTPYLPVRQMLSHINGTESQKSFLNSVRYLAKDKAEDKDFSTEYRRIHRVATRSLTELETQLVQTTMF